MMDLKVEPLFGAAIVEVVLYSFVMHWMGFQTAFARQKYGVKPPRAYEDSDKSVFNRYMRAHMNAVENAPQFFVTLLVAALHKPMHAVIAGAVYIVGRIVYTTQYYKDPGARSRGMFYFFAQLYLYGLCVHMGGTMLTSPAS